MAESGDQQQTDSVAEAEAQQAFATGLASGIAKPETQKPQPTQAQRDRVEDWWKKTNDVPDFRKAVAAWLESQKILYPQWFDRTDPFRGGEPQELKTRESDRRVRVQYIYRNVQQMLAMLLPEDHSHDWEPVKEVGADPQKPNQLLGRFAETLHAEIDAHTDEINWQDVTNGFGQDALCFRIACLKITYDSSFINSPLHIDDEGQDKQKSIQKLRVLAEDFARNKFTNTDGRYQEMMELKEALGIEGELQYWSGIRAENVPLDSIRWSSTVRDLDRIHLSPWMSQDAMMTVSDIREKFPFVWDNDADGKQLKTWKGIHPDDLDTSSGGTRSQNARVMGDTFWTTQTASAAGGGAQAVPTSEAQAKRLLVREIWSRSENRVTVLVEGVEYEALTYVPKKPWSKWYPFHLMRLNRVTGTCYGISDVELMHDIQNRINSKRSDEEKARWLSISRWVYDTTLTDEENAIKLKDINPGELRGINFQGKKMSDVIMELKIAFNLESFDTTVDRQEMQQIAGLSDASQGVTGRAKFSSEVKSADAGTQVSNSGRSSVVRRTMEGVYTHIAELLIQELEPEQVKMDCGENAFWPHVYGADEARDMMAKIKAQAEQQIQQQEAAASDTAAMSGQPAPHPNPDERASAVAKITEQMCLEATGFPEIMTREALFRRLRCKVSVALNAQNEANAKATALQALFESILAGAQAAQAAGYTFDPMIIVKEAGNPEWDGLFSRDPNQLGKSFAQLAQANPTALDPMLAYQVVKLLMPAAQQAEQQMMAQQAQQQQPGAEGAAPVAGEQPPLIAAPAA